MHNVITNLFMTTIDKLLLTLLTTYVATTVNKHKNNRFEIIEGVIKIQMCRAQNNWIQLVQQRANLALLLFCATIIVICILLMSVLKASISWLNHDIWSSALKLEVRYFSSREIGNLYAFLIHMFGQIITVQPGPRGCFSSILPNRLTLF